MVTWIGGVLAGALLIGAGLYFGLSMLQKDHSGASTASSAGTNQPVQAQPQPAVAKRNSPQPTAPSARPAPTPIPAPAPAQSEETDGAMAPGAVTERMATDPDTVNDPDEARPQPVAPRAATTGGIAAARLPTGDATSAHRRGRRRSRRYARYGSSNPAGNRRRRHSLPTAYARLTGQNQTRAQPRAQSTDCTASSL